MFKVVKRYYDLGIYSKENVKVFVVAGRLTAEDYRLITGDEYTA
ncbi:MAG TPA: XkdX family protein [Lachnospiraceae bacterium]|nr:XkdX family protein [Lachnospiraceae bacterium]